MLTPLLTGGKWRERKEKGGDFPSIRVCLDRREREERNGRNKKLYVVIFLIFI